MCSIIIGISNLVPDQQILNGIYSEVPPNIEACLQPQCHSLYAVFSGHYSSQVYLQDQPLIEICNQPLHPKEAAAGTMYSWEGKGKKKHVRHFKMVNKREGTRKKKRKEKGCDLKE